MDIKDIKEIVELMKEHDLTKFELEEEAFRLALARGAEQVVTMAAAPAMPSASQPVALPTATSTAQPAADEDAGLADIKSPIVGTFYRSSTPDSDPFVSVGQAVDKDTVVCIVEAMKVMNEIKADCKGVITKICVDNSSPVQFGQALFKVKPQ
jgi:acetyl-CoA carboxylase biotin carboxyl carrier protein